MLSKQEKFEAKKVSQARGLAKFLSVDICIKIFGVVIWEYHFPPKEVVEPEN